MTRFPTRSIGTACALALLLGLAACGGGGGNGASNTLTVLSTDDFDSLDPGTAYNQLTFSWLSAVQRPLYSHVPGDPTRLVPDLATAAPRISADAKTITVHIKAGVKFSPPVNRAVTSDDVKYAIERGFTKGLGNQYVDLYFADLVGAPAARAGGYRAIAGITTPDLHTIVLKLTKPVAPYVAQALSLPLTAPVPRDYARPFDSHEPSQYGAHQVATGPYMIPLIGGKVDYQAGRRLVLERNPNWKRSTDFRPAHVAHIDWRIGGDGSIIGKQVLAGSHLIDADQPPAPVVRQAVTQSPGQISFAASGNRYVALNTSIPPFDNINLRKAVNAAIDKTQLRLTRGGPTTGTIATHYLSPGIPGFAQAGGSKGPGYDFDRSPTGDMALAARYIKAAGFPSGRYSGPPILVIGNRETPASTTAEAVDGTLRQLGFRTKLREYSNDTMQSLCSVPKTKAQVCPNHGWGPDFFDGQAYLDVTFNGASISPAGSPNFSELDDPAINAAMARAALTSEPAARAAAWGKVDDMITATAAAVPWLWDKLPNVESKDVRGVIAEWNGAWDLSFTSLK